MRLGIQSAFHEVNQDGGVHGRRLELETLDDQYEPDDAFSNTLRLMRANRVFALIGEVGTPTSRAAVPVAGATGVPFLAPFTGAEFLRDPGLKHVLNLRASYYQETEEMVDYSASKVFAYRLSDKARASALEFDLTADQNGTPISPFGLWSDGETMFVSDWQRGEIFAYSLSDGQRQPNRNIDTSECGTSYPSGIWSDGETLWVVDDLAKRVCAYTVPDFASLGGRTP